MSSAAQLLMTCNVVAKMEASLRKNLLNSQSYFVNQMKMVDSVHYLYLDGGSITEEVCMYLVLLFLTSDFDGVFEAFWLVGRQFAGVVGGVGLLGQRDDQRVSVLLFDQLVTVLVARIGQDDLLAHRHDVAVLLLKNHETL